MVVGLRARSKPRSPSSAGEDKRVFLDDMGLTEPGLDRVIRAGYRLLGLQTYFTVRAEGSPRLDHPTATPRRRPPA